MQERSKARHFTLASVLALMGAGTAISESEAAIYVKIPGIKGDVVEVKGLQGAIRLDSWQWGAASVDQGRKGIGVCFSEMTVTRTSDVHTPTLNQFMADSTVLPGTALYIGPEGTIGGGWFKYSFSDDFQVSSLSQSSGGDRSTESITFKFSSVAGTFSESSDPSSPVLSFFEFMDNLCP